MVDCATQALSYLLYASGQMPERKTEPAGDPFGALDDLMLDAEVCYNVYGTDD